MTTSSSLATSLLCATVAVMPSVASAGVTWYLLSPPVVQTVDGEFYGADTNAPLSRWLAMRQYDTAVECREDRATVRTQMHPLAVTQSSGAEAGLAGALEWSAQESVCVASDDIPRLPTGRGAAFGESRAH